MLTHENLMRANERDYVLNLPADTRKELVQTTREGRPSDCMECIFFKWIEDERNELRESCALGYDSELHIRMKDKICPVAE